MSKFKYIKRGIKRKHNIIEDILPVLERIAQIEGVKKVTPAKISYSPARNIGRSGPHVRFQRETVSGFKLLAHGRGSIQEIFVVVDGSKKKEIENKLKEVINEDGIIGY